MQVTAVDDKYKYQDIDADNNEDVDSSTSDSTDNADFSLSNTLKMVGGGKSEAGKNRSLTGQANDISKGAANAGKEFKQNVKNAGQEVAEFKAFNAQQQQVMEKMLQDLDAVYAEIDSENAELENMQTSTPPTSPLKAPVTGGSDDGSDVPVAPTTGDSTSEAESLTASIQTKQTNAFGIIANYTRASRNVELRKSRTQNHVKSYHKAAKKSAAAQTEANSAATKILKVSQTTSTIGSAITVAGIVGKAVGWAMNATGVAAAAGTAIITACKTIVCPAGELVFGVGKAGECGSNIALGNTNAALIAGGEAILSFVSFGSDLKTIAKASKISEAVAATTSSFSGVAVTKADVFAGVLDATTKNASKVGQLINGYVKPALQTAQVTDLYTKVATKKAS